MYRKTMCSAFFSIKSYDQWLLTVGLSLYGRAYQLSPYI